MWWWISTPYGIIPFSSPSCPSPSRSGLHCSVPMNLLEQTRWDWAHTYHACYGLPVPKSSLFRYPWFRMPVGPELRNYGVQRANVSKYIPKGLRIYMVFFRVTCAGIDSLSWSQVACNVWLGESDVHSRKQGRSQPDALYEREKVVTWLFSLRIPVRL